MLGGDDAYARLSTAVHARGWRILGDLTTNHTGDTHEWFLDAATDPASERRTWYHFAPDGSYECWMGWRSLPKLNHADPGARQAMVSGPDSVVARWLRPPFSVDGWRIDVANMTGRLGALDVNHAVAQDVRRTVTAERPDGLVIGEHNHDATGDLDGDGWHGTMNYSGFAWPVWAWLRDPDSPARAFGRPVPVPRRSGRQVQRSLREWLASYGWRATSASWNVLGSHDSARIRTVVGDPAIHRVAAGLQFTLPGVPWSSPATRSASRASRARTPAARCPGTAPTPGTTPPSRRTPPCPGRARTTSPSAAAASVMQAFRSGIPWDAALHSWVLLDSHDTPRFGNVSGSSARHLVGLGLQMTSPGVPMVFAGDEIGLEGVNGEDSRRTMPWHRPEQWDRATLTTYADLARLRRAHLALRRGGLRWAHVDADTISYLREHPGGSVLVVARRAAGDAFHLPVGPGRHLFGSEPGGVDLVPGAGGTEVPRSDGPRVDVWELGTE